MYICTYACIYLLICIHIYTFFFLQKMIQYDLSNQCFFKIIIFLHPSAPLLAVGEASSLWRRMRRSKWGFGACGRLLSTDWKCLQSSKRTTTREQSTSLDPSQNNPVVLCLKIRDLWINTSDLARGRSDICNSLARKSTVVIFAKAWNLELWNGGWGNEGVMYT